MDNVAYGSAVMFTAVDLSSIRIGVTLNFIEPRLVEADVDCVAFAEV